MNGLIPVSILKLALVVGAGNWGFAYGNCRFHDFVAEALRNNTDDSSHINLDCSHADPAKWWYLFIDGNDVGACLSGVPYEEQGFERVFPNAPK